MFCPVCRAEYRPGLTRCNDCDVDLVAELSKQDWRHNADVGTVGVLTLAGGECLTAEILDYDDEGKKLIVDVVCSRRPHTESSQQGRTIPVSRVLSFEPRPHAKHPWPYSDPCRDTSFSIARFVLMATLFLTWTIGSVPLFLLLMKRPYGIQEASAMTYTIFAVFFTFARTGSKTGKDLPPYKFTCPVVHMQISRLLWRHLGFLVALFALQTLALTVRPNLPEWWNTDRKGTPFEMVLLFLCIGLGFAQVITNRRLLDRSHREFSP